MPAHRSLPLSSPPTGYLLALGPLLFISICDVWLQLFSRDQAYAINLAAVGTVAFGCTGRDRAGVGQAGGLSPSLGAHGAHPTRPRCSAGACYTGQAGRPPCSPPLSWVRPALRPSSRDASSRKLFVVNETKAS